MSLIKLRKLLTTLNNEKGASAVEFALILPILMLLILGIIQFGFIFFHYISITHAAREGARWAALGEDNASVRAKVKNSAPGLVLNDSDISINPVGESVTVRVQYGSPIIAPFIGDVMGVSGTDIELSNAATQRIE